MRIIGAVLMAAGALAELIGILRLRHAGLAPGEKPSARLMAPLILGSVALSLGVVFFAVGGD